MQAIFNVINIPLGYILRFLADICGGNFAAAVLLFTILINLVLLPLTLKSQKSSVQQHRIKPKLDELKKRCGDDRQKYSLEMQKLYQDEGVSMSGGCLPMIVRMLLMFSIYYLILSPLTYMVGADRTQVSNVKSAVSTAMTDMQKEDEERYKEIVAKVDWNNRYSQNNELGLIRILRQDPDILREILTEEEYKKIENDVTAIIEKDNEKDINFNLFGIKKLDLTQIPHFSFDIFHKAEWIWLIPIGAFLSQILTSFISMAIQKRQNPEAPNMVMMMVIMSLFSLSIGFAMPGGVGFYWICSSLVGGLFQSGLQFMYGPHQMLARERATELLKQSDVEEKQLKRISLELGSEERD